MPATRSKSFAAASARKVNPEGNGPISSETTNAVATQVAIEAAHAAVHTELRKGLADVRTELGRLAERIEERQSEQSVKDLETKVSELVERDSAARSALQERVYHLQQTIAGLLVAREASRKVAARLEGVERRMSWVERVVQGPQIKRAAAHA
jgi:hypothetical protein